MPYGKKTAYKKGCFKMTGPSLYKKKGCAMCDYGKKKCTCNTSMKKRGCKKKY